MIPYAELDHILIFFSIFLCTILLFKRTLSLFWGFGALVCACLFVWFDGHFWLGEVTLPPGKNPQITTVALMAFSCVAMAALAAVRKSRTLDRVMMALASGSLLATFVIFHYVLIQQVLPAWSKDAAWGNSFLLPVPSSGFRDACVSAGLTCWTKEDIESSLVTPAYRQQIEGIYSFYKENEPSQEEGHGFGVFNDLSPDGVAVVLYHQNGPDVRVISDTKAGVRIHSNIRDLFYLLAAVAHTIWLAGALFLLSFHKVRFGRRSAPC